MAIGNAVPAQLNSSLDNGTPLPSLLSPRTSINISTVNPRDGAIVTLKDDRISAEAQNGDKLTLYTKGLGYSFSHGSGKIFGLADGTLAASENGIIVVIRRDQTVTLVTIGGEDVLLGKIGERGFDSHEALVGHGWLSEPTYKMLACVHDNDDDFSKLPEIRQDFDPTTERRLARLQQHIISQRYGLNQNT